MSKDKYEITIFNHLNFFILYEMYDSFNRKNENINISTLLERVEENTGINKNLNEFFEFVNPGTVFSLLYTSLVIPKELFENEELGEEFFKDYNEDFENYFSIKKGKQFLASKYSFLRKVRNSISHANFSWADNRSDITLWNNSNGKINFEIESDLNKITNFCLSLSRYLSQNQDKLN
jgi:hypothetical protein